MHASIMVGGITILGSDLPAGPSGFQIFLEVEEPAETERLFHALADNATVQVPIQQTFWSQRFGVLTDQFGIPWSLSCTRMPEPGPGSF